MCTSLVPRIPIPSQSVFDHFGGLEYSESEVSAYVDELAAYMIELSKELVSRMLYAD